MEWGREAVCVDVVEDGEVARCVGVGFGIVERWELVWGG